MIHFKAYDQRQAGQNPKRLETSVVLKAGATLTNIKNHWGSFLVAPSSTQSSGVHVVKCIRVDDHVDIMLSGPSWPKQVGSAYIFIFQKYTTFHVFSSVSMLNWIVITIRKSTLSN